MHHFLNVPDLFVHELLVQLNHWETAIRDHTPKEYLTSSLKYELYLQFNG